MSLLRTLAAGAALLLVASVAQSQDRTQYRDYRLGNDLRSVAGRPVRMAKRRSFATGCGMGVPSFA